MCPRLHLCYINSVAGREGIGVEVLQILKGARVRESLLCFIVFGGGLENTEKTSFSKYFQITYQTDTSKPAESQSNIKGPWVALNFHMSSSPGVKC